MHHLSTFKHLSHSHLSPKTFIMLILLLLTLLQPQAQPNEDAIIQELEQDIASGKFSDDEIFSKYEWLLYEYSARSREKTNLCFQKAIALAQENKKPEFEAQFLAVMGYIYHTWEENDTALFYFDKALKLIENKGFYYQEASIYGMMGVFNTALNNFEKAMANLLKALSLNEKYKAAKIAGKQDITKALRTELNILNSISNIYYRQFNPNMYLEYVLRAKKVMDDNPTVNFGNAGINIIANISHYYLDRKEAEKAFPFIEQMYQLAIKNDNIRSILSGLLSYAEYYKLREDHKTQLRYVKEALQIAKEMDVVFYIIETEILMMRTYFDLKDVKTALYYGERLLLRVPEDDWLALSTIYSYLTMIYASTGDYKRAEEYREKHYAITEKMSEKNLHDAVQEMKVKYDVQQKELEIVAQQAKIKQQRTRQFIYIGVIIAAGLMLTMLFLIIRQRNRRNRELAEINAIKDKFFTIISHDLKTPVVAQREALQLLDENVSRWDTVILSNYCRHLLKSANGLADLLKNLLSWAQIQTGHDIYHPLPFNLISALQPDLDVIKSMAERKEIRFEAHLPPEAIITGDENMLLTVVRNLLANAVKFTAAGGKVVLEIKEIKEIKGIKGYADKGIKGGADKGIKQYIISVSDDGVGMTPEQIQNLFCIGSQQLCPGTIGEQGTGLGLIVCKEMIEKHGSKLHVESEEEKGSRFWFEIK